MKVSSHFKSFNFQNFEINFKDFSLDFKTESIEIMSPFHGSFIAYCLECYPNLKSLIFSGSA